MNSLIRTSPKGGPFIGRCIKCGTDGLTLSASHDCPNPAALDNDDTLVLALRLVDLDPKP